MIRTAAVAATLLLAGCHRYNAIMTDMQLRKECVAATVRTEPCARLLASQPVADRIWNADLQDMGLASRTPEGIVQPTALGVIVGGQANVWPK